MSAVEVGPETRPVDLAIGPHRFVDALRCTLQSDHGLLYLNATVEQPAPLAGYDRTMPLPARIADLVALLDALDSAWHCSALRAVLPAAAPQCGPRADPSSDAVSDERIVFGRAPTAVRPAPQATRILAFPGSEGCWLEAELTTAAPYPAADRAAAVAIAGDPSELLVAEAVEALIAARDRDDAEIEVLSVYLRRQLAAVGSDCDEVTAVAVEGLCARVTLDPRLPAETLRRRMFERGVLVSVGAADVVELCLPPIVRPAEVDVVSGVMRAAIFEWPVYSQAPCCDDH